MSTKLTYFDFRGLGESLRYLLRYAGIDFEDVRITFEEWPKVKTSMPFGQMPLYEEKGKTVTQSLAIARYIAKKAKLVGKTDWEDLEIDAIVDTINDIRQRISTYLLNAIVCTLLLRRVLFCSCVNMSVKLTYFNLRGRAEVIRYLLKYGGIEFEDVRVPSEDWMKVKPSMYLF
ncbi:glutathione s-transferase [Holotrichia oblita]|uniref:Glutathione s-transferase n=1 Tax=Holotrichia oblita TaxID=644536 RepID=A0ACB9TVX1_HOLOL|nr:glutathione s-transferase [Holotrichia oblita]